MVLEAILVVVAGLYAWAAVSDARTMIIPNVIPASIFGLYLVFQAAQWFLGLDPAAVPLLPSLAAGAAVSVIFVGLFALNWLGGGDVKLIGASAFWAGTQHLLDFFVVMAIAGGLLSIFFLVKNKVEEKKTQDKQGKIGGSAKTKERKKSHIPYGIAISTGGLFTVNEIITFLLA